jgi:hypothetical protein
MYPQTTQIDDKIHEQTVQVIHQVEPRTSINQQIDRLNLYKTNNATNKTIKNKN